MWLQIMQFYIAAQSECIEGDSHIAQVHPGEGDPMRGVEGGQQAVPQLGRQPQQAAIVLRHDDRVVGQ